MFYPFCRYTHSQILSDRLCCVIRPRPSGLGNEPWSVISPEFLLEIQLPLFERWGILYNGLWETNSVLAGQPTFPSSIPATWDAMKAALRSPLSVHSSLQKQAQARKRRDLEAEVASLEPQHKRSPTPTNLDLMTGAKIRLNMDHNSQIQKLLFLTKQRFFEFGNKPTNWKKSRTRDRLKW